MFGALARGADEADDRARCQSTTKGRAPRPSRGARPPGSVSTVVSTAAATFRAHAAACLKGGYLRATPSSRACCATAAITAGATRASNGEGMT